jgi:hydrogenase nickel incorporation protein HypB
MFRTSQALIISKTDLLPWVPFSIENAIHDAKLIQPELKTFALSALRDEGIEDCCRYLESARKSLVQQQAIHVDDNTDQQSH